MKFTGVDPDLSNSLSFLEYGEAEYRGYPLRLCYFGVLDSFVFGGVGDDNHLAIKNLRQALLSIKRALPKVEVAQTMRTHGDQVFLRGIKQQDTTSVCL